MASRKREFDLAECYALCDSWLRQGTFAGYWLGRLIHEVARLRGLLSIGRVAMAFGLKREKRLRARIAKLEAQVVVRQALDDRPLDDDLNVLWNRCDARAPLSLADQRELYDWLQEKDVTISDYDKKIVDRDKKIVGLETEIVAMLSTGLLLNARWVGGWCVVYPNSNFDTQCKRLVELGAWKRKLFSLDNTVSYRPIESQELAESGAERSER
jgi:hypothetical protein